MDRRKRSKLRISRKNKQASSVLRSSHESKAKELGKGGRKAMKSNGKRRSARGTSVTSKTLVPVQTPMRTLRSRLSVCRFDGWFLLQRNRLRRKENRL